MIIVLSVLNVSIGVCARKAVPQLVDRETICLIDNIPYKSLNDTAIFAGFPLCFYGDSISGADIVSSTLQYSEKYDKYFLFCYTQKMSSGYLKVTRTIFRSLYGKNGKYDAYSYKFYIDGIELELCENGRLSLLKNRQVLRVENYLDPETGIIIVQIYTKASKHIHE